MSEGFFCWLFLFGKVFAKYLVWYNVLKVSNYNIEELNGKKYLLLGNYQ